jgi:hypothetical protein
MSLNSLQKILVGDPGQGPLVSLAAALQEIQGLTFSMLSSAGAGAKNALAAIRSEDTILAAINNNAGTLTNLAFTQGVKATGTLTFAAAVNTDTFVVNGVTFNIKTSPVAGVLTDVAVGASNNAMATLAAAAINAYFGATDGSVTASAATNVVTITASASGTGPNSYTTVGGAHITAGAATLANGTADAGITISDTRASGTLTFASAIAGDTFVVNSVTFTVKAAADYVATNFQHVLLGTSDRLMAAYARDRINKFFDAKDGSVVASVLSNVVTVRGTLEGSTVPNAYTLVGGARITASGATLSGGTATGGISVVAATNQVLLFWFNKRS